MNYQEQALRTGIILVVYMLPHTLDKNRTPYLVFGKKKSLYLWAQLIQTLAFLYAAPQGNVLKKFRVKEAHNCVFPRKKY